ncbi:Candidapepsin-10 [Candida viswanathii]|uniref:Candidapepsin-10 n=1 Tax=Candida viswanathii TaxID=5486 RepID=A0A367YHA5_9ASCO|nr:Candidapepsin-10 [Candida viswanathii]
MNFLLLACYIVAVSCGSLQLDLHQMSKAPHHHKREIGLLLNHHPIYFGVDLGFGSNNETLEVNVDTGSSDLWVPDASGVCTPEEQAATRGCPLVGFNWQDSTSFVRTFDWFYRGYGDGTSARGFIGQDTVSMGDVRVNNTIFAVTHTDNDVGILGLGSPELEATYASNGTMYENFPQRLKSEGIIDRVLYSVGLHRATPAGTLLFGAVDHKKYVENLVTLPVLPGPAGLRDRFIVQVDSILLGEDGRIATLVSLSCTALLDTGCSHTLIKPGMISKISKILGGEGDDESGYTVNSTLAKNKKLYITFPGKTIDVLLNLGPADEDGMSDLSYISQDLSTNFDIIIGQDVLTQMYLVFDLESLEISVAKQSTSTESDIEVVGADGKFNKTTTYKRQRSAASPTKISSTYLLLLSLFMTLSACL